MTESHPTDPASPASPARPATARDLVLQALHRAVPGADLTTLGDEQPLRSELELDSLDFLAFVEELSNASGVRLDERDYARLTTVESCAALLRTRRGSSGQRDP